MSRWLFVVAVCSSVLITSTYSKSGCPRPLTISVNVWNAMSADAQDAACGGGQSAQRMSLETHIQQLIGPDAVDCGTQQRGSSIPEAMHQSLACARDAANQHRSFQFIQWVQGEDSEIAFGVIGDRSGSTRWFDYDSAPCGGPGCRERFDTRACPLSSVVVVHEADGRHQFKCIDRRQPHR
jgi:hypothetical protein